MQSVLNVDRIKEDDSKPNPYLAEAVIAALDAKEELFIVNSEDALFDIQNLKTINSLIDSLMEEYRDNKDPEKLRQFQSNFKKVLECSFINFSFFMIFLS